jgi:metallo-beta-lactamase family protein
MQLEFFGAAGEVTGSCHILTINGHKVLLDCGMIQGGRKQEARNREPFPFNAAKVDAVVLSHAHIDHSGRLPLLARRGFSGIVWCQNATRDLCGILLEDSARLQERDAEYNNRRYRKQGRSTIKPLYSVDDAHEAISKLKGIRYSTWQEVVPGMRVRFHDAGHIMGSGSVEIKLQEGSIERTVVFSGDLGQYDAPILRDPVSVEHADLVLMESTYGGRRHRDRSETILEIGEIIREARQRKGNILIPAFAIGRSQEVLYHLGMHYDEWGVDRFKVFLDSPMAIEASRVYWDYPHLYDDEATRLRRGENEMPILNNLELSRSADASRAINAMKGGAIVIAGSGMCNGGRILHHLKYNLWREGSQVIIVGYQAQGSLGRRLVDGARRVRIHGDEIQVKAQIRTVGGLSAHGDQDDLARWYEGFKNQPPLYLVHGEVESSAELRDYLRNRCGIEARLTGPGLKIDLVEIKSTH